MSHQQFEESSLAKNDGQVKLNTGNGIKPEWNSGTASINSIWQQIMYTPPFGLSSFPTTSWPLNIPSPGVSDLYLAPTNTYIENTIPGQNHIWRVQISFSKNSGQTNISIRIQNTLSGFIVTQITSIASGVNDGVILMNIITIADGASLPPPFGVGQGYEMHVQASDGSFQIGARFLRIESIARISLHHSIRY